MSGALQLRVICAGHGTPGARGVGLELGLPVFGPAVVGLAERAEPDVVEGAHIADQALQDHQVMRPAAALRVQRQRIYRARHMLIGVVEDVLPPRNSSSRSAQARVPATYSCGGKSARYHDTGISRIGLASAELAGALPVERHRPRMIRLELPAHQRAVPLEAVLLQQPQRRSEKSHAGDR